MGKRISKDEVYDNRFYRIPKAFFKVDKYKDMSLAAKITYGFLDDRRELSLKNNWVDDENNIYLIFTRNELGEMLCLSNKTVVKAFKELRDMELIEEVRQGVNKPNLIYVCHLDLEGIENTWKCKNYISGSVENTLQEVKNLHPNDTEYSEPDFNDIYNGTSGADKFSSLCPKILSRYKKAYKKHIGKYHPPLSSKQVANINYYITEIINDDDTILLTDWQKMIDKHFNTDYKGKTDYNANHFFTPGVLKNRYYEVVYRKSDIV